MNALMRQSDLMELLRISRSTLWRMSQQENFPKPVFVRGMKRWRLEEIETWLRGRQEVAVAEVPQAGW